MVTELKNVLIIDGTGWIPYWGNVVVEDQIIKQMTSGENVLIAEEPGYDRILNFKPGDFPGKTAPEAYLIPGLSNNMTMEQYQEELDAILADMKTGTKPEKAFRKLTGLGTGQREFLVEGMPANFMIVDKPITKILTAFAGGREL